MRTQKMSLRGVVENLEATPSSQDRAFCSDTPGAAETMSDPTDANPLAAPHSTAAEPLALLAASADAIDSFFPPFSATLLTSSLTLSQSQRREKMGVLRRQANNAAADWIRMIWAAVGRKRSLISVQAHCG